MKATWTGLILCAIVIYFGVVHSLPNPEILLNSHAMILVCGGTVAIAFLTYSRERLAEMMNFIMYGFLFRVKNTERTLARDLISHIDLAYRRPPTFALSRNIHPFLTEAYQILQRNEMDAHQLETVLKDRRNAIKRKYIEDAKILNNLAKYPTHLGLLGACSGMIHMMTGLGKDGIESIGSAMAVALTATLWGVGLNNFVFLPLADNSMKVSEDEIFLRDIIIDCIVMIRQNRPYPEVIRSCLNKLPLADRTGLRQEYKEAQEKMKSLNAAA